MLLITYFTTDQVLLSTFVLSGDEGPQMLRRQWGGTSNKIFSVVLLAAPTVVMMEMPAMLPSVPFGGILTTVVLLSPAIPLTIHPR